MADNVVHQVVFNVKVFINEWPMGGEENYKYDWSASNGDESYELFATVDDALRSARDHFGG